MEVNVKVSQGLCHVPLFQLLGVLSAKDLGLWTLGGWFWFQKNVVWFSFYYTVTLCAKVSKVNYLVLIALLYNM